MLPDSALLPVPAAEVAALPEVYRERLETFVKLAKGAYAANTLKALKHDGQLFATWCAQRSLPWLPASPDTVRRFLDDIGQSRKPSTLSRYLSSIATLHAAAELPNPCATLSVKLTRKKHARDKGVRRRQAEALGEDLIAAMLERIAEVEVPGPADIRDTALLLVARDTLARASELVALRWEDLSETPDGEGAILLRRSKTDQEGQGALAWLSAEAMAALAAWRSVQAGVVAAARLQERVIDPEIAPEQRVPVERFVFCNLDPVALGVLTTRSVSRIFQKRAWDAGLPGSYSAHSTRVGGAQDLLAAGFDLPGVMQAGRWASPTQAARYGERLLAQRSAVAQHRRRKAEPGGEG